MQQGRAVSRQAHVDMVELLARVDNDRELLHDLLSIFLDEFPRHFQALRRAVARQDCEQVATVSHTVKGMLLNLAVTPAAASVARLEHLAGNSDKLLMREAFIAFEQQVSGLLPEMESHLAEAQP